MSNLLDNAVKYSGAGDGDENREIAVTLRQDGNEAVISVRDHGIGIPRDEQKKIFDRFHRVGTVWSTTSRGAAWASRSCSTSSRPTSGRVTVESRPGEGSTFSIHLPLAASPSGAGELAGARRVSEA